MKFMHIREPYGTLHLEKCEGEEFKSEKGTPFYTIEGIVEKGATYSFGFGRTYTRDEKGTKHTVYRVTKKELEQGYKRDIAM